jgi:hypothetical protein
LAVIEALDNHAFPITSNPEETVLEEIRFLRGRRDTCYPPGDIAGFRTLVVANGRSQYLKCAHMMCRRISPHRSNIQDLRISVN